MSRNTCRTLTVSATALAMTLVALAGPAAARDPREKLWRKACTGDAFALCPLQAMVADRAGVRDCLLRKMDKVSEPCTAVIRAAMPQQLTARVPPGPPIMSTAPASRFDGGQSAIGPR